VRYPSTIELAFALLLSHAMRSIGAYEIDFQ